MARAQSVSFVSHFPIDTALEFLWEAKPSIRLKLIHDFPEGRKGKRMFFVITFFTGTVGNITPKVVERLMAFNLLSGWQKHWPTMYYLFFLVSVLFCFVLGSLSKLYRKVSPNFIQLPCLRCWSSQDKTLVAHKVSLQEIDTLFWPDSSKSIAPISQRSAFNSFQVWILSYIYIWQFSTWGITRWRPWFSLWAKKELSVILFFCDFRPDRTLQDIVYKIVPGIYHGEKSLCNRILFMLVLFNYLSHNQVITWGMYIKISLYGFHSTEVCIICHVRFIYIYIYIYILVTK